MLNFEGKSIIVRGKLNSEKKYDVKIVKQFNNNTDVSLSHNGCSYKSTSSWPSLFVLPQGLMLCSTPYPLCLDEAFGRICGKWEGCIKPHWRPAELWKDHKTFIFLSHCAWLQEFRGHGNCWPVRLTRLLGALLKSALH